MRIAIIPARGGSRRVPRKNIREFAGKPMLSYPVETAKASGLFDMIVVSTDDFEIAGVAFALGATVIPRPMDDGTTGTQEIAARVLDKLEIMGSTACVIYPCSPLLTPQLLKDGYQRLLQPQWKSFARSVSTDGKDAGCFYWGWIQAFRDRKPLDAFNTSDFVLPEGHACDIDTPSDWDRAQKLFNAMLNQRGGM